MLSMTSRAAPTEETAPVPCTTCRKRRVKCDKRLPGCLRCENSGSGCPGYNRVRGILDQGPNLRHKYSAEILSPSNGSRGERVGGASITAIASPAIDPLTTITPSRSAGSSKSSHNIDDHDHQEDSSQAVAASDAVVSDAAFDDTFFDIDPDVYYADGANCCGWVPNLPVIQNNDAPVTSWLDTQLGHDWSSVPSNSSPSIPAPNACETEVTGEQSPNDDKDAEMSHLIQHFSEHISPCLDVFDSDRFFGLVVPVKAIRSILLSSLLAAISAKQFAKSKRGQIAKTTSILDHYYYAIPIEEWFYKAASFYDRSIYHMRHMLQSLQNSVSTEEEASSIRDAPTPVSFRPPNKRRRLETSYQRSSTNPTSDLLVAVSVFLLYECLDDRQSEMIGHMVGAQFLLSKGIPTNNQWLYKRGQTRIPRGFETSKGWISSFWNIVHADCRLSYSERRVPTLDTQDKQLWQAAGLPLFESDDGSLVPEALLIENNQDTEILGSMSETGACRTLLWIILRTLSYFATEEDTRNRSYWNSLRQYLQLWSEELPLSFEPFASHTYTPPSQVQTKTANSDMTSIHYTGSMASTTMVLYHFVQIFLLLHQPSASSSSRVSHGRVADYRKTVQELDEHAAKIYGICLGQRQSLNIRIHAVPALHLAGLCLEPKDQRETLQHLLSDIQSETGFSTGRIFMLLQREWGWENSEATEATI